ncbi:hypothetical protein [Hydrogenophaga taeniospiralis]|uniref:hypothetical protein n=1 Tax=Hydrogenophaga taeniospiralis TaxID=65656 RepID=UPI001CF93997|nr:hypothetical protein [Hydrogenophaga taeniospiralis]UCU92679.1 hypothetical protein KI616_17825 [Hydrogenophaga taeniospiralis]
MSTKGKKVQKSVIYKRVNFHSGTKGKTLKALLEDALSKRKTLGERRQNVASAEDPIYHAIGAPVCENTGFVFGTLMTYTPGTDPLCFIDDDKAEEVVLEKVSAPKTDDGKRREFLASMMYFGVIGNHMVLMQSQALKSAQLESYLRWYLHASAVLEGTNTFQLIDTPGEAVKKKLNQGKGVRAIKLGGEVLPPSLIPPQPSDQPTGTATTKHVAAQTTATAVATQDDFGVLAALKRLMSPVQAAKIDFEKLAGSNIELSVTLRYSRKTTEDGQKLMDSLGAAFRNTDDVETELELVDGGSIKGSDLKLTGTVSITTYDGQLSASEVYEGLRQWLLQKVSAEELSTG